MKRSLECFCCLLWERERYSPKMVGATGATFDAIKCELREITEISVAIFITETTALRVMNGESCVTNLAT